MGNSGKKYATVQVRRCPCKHPGCEKYVFDRFIAGTFEPEDVDAMIAALKRFKRETGRQVE